MPPGDSLLEKQEWLVENDESLRRLLCFEPRGGGLMCCQPKIFGPLILLGFSVVDSFFLQSSTVRIVPGSCQPMIHVA